MSDLAWVSPEPQRRRDLRWAALLATWMLLCAVLAYAITPRQPLAATRGPLKLAQLLPHEFRGWREEQGAFSGVINPQQADLVERLYSEVVSRTYVNNQGDRVMLSIAYGQDQRDALALHYPEVCYPAQGFQLKSTAKVELDTPFGRIPARQLETVYGARRYEPVTYWTTLGDKVVRGGMNKKLAEMELGLSGTIPDGLLFRVSSIERDSPRAYALHNRFVVDLLATVSPGLRLRLAGLP